MTERQVKLKDEIISISDELQLGIYENDKDWFFDFIKKMDYGVEVDCYRTNTGWCKIANMNLSLDFIREFKKRFDWKLNWLQNKNKLPIVEVLPEIGDYIMTWEWAILNKIGQSDELTDVLVDKYEKLFDQTCEGRTRNGAPSGHDYTAWYYIGLNTKLSTQMRQYAKTKMQFNDIVCEDNECGRQKSFFEKMFS